MKLKLVRFRESQYGTFGKLSLGGKHICYTLEEPWRKNERRISCIPEGTYTCVPHNGARFKDVWRLENVPGRDAVLIHIGNTLADTEGCILVGMRDIETGIGDSRKAMTLLRGMLPEIFDLEIVRE